MSAIQNVLQLLWDWVDGRLIVRRICLFSVLVLTFQSFYWAASWASTTMQTGVDAAAVIAAVTAPIAALQAFVFKWYAEGREK